MAHITLTQEPSGRGWASRATVVLPRETIVVKRIGQSKIRADEAALASVLRRLYEIMEDGEVALNDVFPVDYTRVP